MSKKVVLFDIDYTLFNARLYRERFTKKLEEFLQYSGDDFSTIADEAYTDHRSEYAYFDPIAFAEKLSEKLARPIDKKALKKIVADEKVLEEALYDDSVAVLSSLAKHKDLTLGIFSAGLLHVQRPKIKQLEQFLDKDHIHIYEFKKQHALPELMDQYKYEDVVIIDDMLDVLYIAKRLHPNIHTVWIRRKEENSPRIDNFHPDSIIKTLHEVIPIVLGR